MRSCFALLCGAALLLCFPAAFSLSFAASSQPHSDRAASIDRIGDIVETDTEDDDEYDSDASENDCGCDQGESEFVGSINDVDDEDDDKDYTNDDRYA